MTPVHNLVTRAVICAVFWCIKYIKMRNFARKANKMYFPLLMSRNTTHLLSSESPSLYTAVSAASSPTQLWANRPSSLWRMHLLHLHWPVRTSRFTVPVFAGTESGRRHTNISHYNPDRRWLIVNALKTHWRQRSVASRLLDWWLMMLRLSTADQAGSVGLWAHHKTSETNKRRIHTFWPTLYCQTYLLQISSSNREFIRWAIKSCDFHFGSNFVKCQQILTAFYR